MNVCICLYTFVRQAEFLKITTHNCTTALDAHVNTIKSHRLDNTGRVRLHCGIFDNVDGFYLLWAGLGQCILVFGQHSVFSGDKSSIKLNKDGLTQNQKLSKPFKNYKNYYIKIYKKKNKNINKYIYKKNILKKKPNNGKIWKIKKNR